MFTVGRAIARTGVAIIPMREIVENKLIFKRVRLGYTAMFFAVLEWPGELSVRYGALHYVPACFRQNDRLWKCRRNEKRPYHV